MTAPAAEARRAGLRWVSDQEPGLKRMRHGRGFVYLDARGRPVNGAQALARIRALAVPPAWRDVWICEDPAGHLQATGRDERGRKQYRYHEAWQARRAESKFGRMASFGHVLPRIRARVSADLALDGLPRAKVLAAIVRLLDLTALRVGNEEYARSNDSYGLSTLQHEHAGVRGDTVTLQFTGKSGKDRRVSVDDARVAEVVGACLEAGEGALFRYAADDGTPRGVTAHEVNEYLRDAAHSDVTAKDFRTWTGTVRALHLLRRMPPSGSASGRTRRLNDALREVADDLGNTLAVCRASYVHPAVIETYVTGRALDRGRADVRGLGVHEREALAFLDALPRRRRSAPSRSAQRDVRRDRRAPRHHQRASGARAERRVAAGSAR